MSSNAFTRALDEDAVWPSRRAGGVVTSSPKPRLIGCGRAARRQPSCAQELQIVHFVADGHSNKEVAAQLYLSPRTIDYHLRHVFAKLGITSRTQLASVLVDDAAAGAAGHL